MKKVLLYVFFLLPVLGFAQNSITIQVEQLSKPEQLLPEYTTLRIYKSLIRKDANMSAIKKAKDTLDYPYGILAQSHADINLVHFGSSHPFFQGMYAAYADHRPFVLSPDMIWLLISQGFAHHVNNNAEILRQQLVGFDGKTTLTVLANKYDRRIDNKEIWEKIFPDFTGQIQEHVGKELLDNLTCNFSTTTPASKAAAEITVMESLKAYFEYVAMMIGCGIPEITLEGTPDDWQKALDKARSLRKYELDWWIDELEPLLKELVEASKGKASKNFWMNMFRQHTEKAYGNPQIFDGWIVKFFPYDKDGKRTGLKEIRKWNALPEELVKVDVKYVVLNDAGDIIEEKPLELWAGFIGLRQNTDNYALKPEIGWMVREKNEEAKSKVLLNQLKEQSTGGYFGVGIDIRVNVVPKEILALSSIQKLSIRFTGQIIIPDEMKNIQITTLRLNGAISPEETDRIAAMFPETHLYINNKPYNKAAENITKMLEGKIVGISGE
ncbi:MAG: DUF4419 domain-containing protein [Prevotella sp.]|jgi:hypothetical protein|nr:DUF4419 domain-containing protein [Prevotella sp.]